MSYWQLGVSFLLGTAVGAGVLLYYMQYRTKKQLAAMGEQMEGLMDDGFDVDMDAPADGGNGDQAGTDL